MGADPLVIDDADPQFGYSPGWQRIGGVHSTTQVGATVTFRFKGIAVLVWGVIPASNSNQITTYSIDGGPAERKEKDHTHSGRSEAQQIWRSPVYPEGIHTLTITNVGVNAFQLDRIEMFPGDSDPNPTPLSPWSTNTTPTQEPQTPRPSSTQSPRASSTVNPPRPSSSLTLLPTTPSNDSDSNPDVDDSNFPSPNEPTGSGGPSQSGRTRPSSAFQTQRSSSTNLSQLGVESSGIAAGVRTSDHIQHATFIEKVVTVTDSNGAVRTETSFVSPRSSPLPVGAIVGISIGALAIVVVGLIFIALFLRRKQRKFAKLAGNEEAPAPRFTSESLALPFHRKSPVASPDDGALSSGSVLDIQAHAVDASSRPQNDPPPAYTSSAGPSILSEVKISNVTTLH